MQDRICQPELIDYHFDAKVLAAMANQFRTRPNGYCDAYFWGAACRALSHYVRYENDPTLRTLLDGTVADVLSIQTPDGCISGNTPNRQPYNSDLWDRTYTLFGLLDAYEVTGNPKLLDAATKLADFTISQVGPAPKVPIEKATSGYWIGMDSTKIVDPISRLYCLTGKPQYLEFARYIVEDEGGSNRGRIFEQALSGMDVRDLGGDGNPKDARIHAYTTLSCFEALLEYYRATGNEKWKQAALKFYANVRDTEATVVGGISGLKKGGSLSPSEQFNHSALYQTSPDILGMEGCSHARWLAFCRNLLLATGDSTMGDQIELTMYNALLGSIRPNGKQVDYHTRLSGTRPAPANWGRTFCGRWYVCCNYNIVDALALIPFTTVMSGEGGAVINLYIPCTAKVKLTDGNEVTIEQTTDYPKTGGVEIEVRPRQPARFPIRMRIPLWSKNTLIKINGQDVAAQPGTYLCVNRMWTAGDRISLSLDMRCHLVHSPQGSPQTADGFRALMRGPIVLARDKRLGLDIHRKVDIKADAEGTVELTPVPVTIPALMEFAVPTVNGDSFKVTDFASSGNTWDAQSERITWIPVNATDRGP